MAVTVGNESGGSLWNRILASLREVSLASPWSTWTAWYLSEIAGRPAINRALAKIHLKKLQNAGMVRSRVVLVEGEAKALRYYELQDFEIEVTPEILGKEPFW